MLRQHEWRAYDPEALPALMTDAENVRKAVFLDILKTMKAPQDSQSGSLTISDLVILPTDKSSTAEMSLVAEDLNVSDVADFFIHPGENKFIECLPLEESAAVCVVLEGLTRNYATAEHLVSRPNFDFLGRYMYISRYVIEQGKLTNVQLLVLVNGLFSAAAAMERLVWVATGYETREDIVVESIFSSLGLIDAVAFWISTLAEDHKGMDSLVLSTLRETGLVVLTLIHKIANLLLRKATSTENERVSLLLSCNEWAKVCSKVIGKCHIVFAGKKALKYEVLDKSCRFCAAMLENEKCTSEAK
jgi:hypothetical protein